MILIIFSDLIATQMLHMVYYYCFVYSIVEAVEALSFFRVFFILFVLTSVVK